MHRTYDDFREDVLERDVRDTEAGKDAEATLDLADDVRDYVRFYCYSSDSDGVQWRLAEEIARADVNFNPTQMRYLSKASELPEGELLARNIREINGQLSTKDGRNSMIQHLYHMADSIASKAMTGREWEDIQERRLEEELQAEVDAEMRENEPYMRQMIYEQENISPDTPDSRLPYYVAKRMEEAGVTLNTDEVKPIKTKFSYELSATPKDSTIKEDKRVDFGKKSVDRPVGHRPLPSFGMSNSLGEKDDGWNFDEKE